MLKVCGNGPPAADKLGGMVTQVVGCHHCGSENLVKKRSRLMGGKIVGCKDCGKTVRRNVQSYSEREEVLGAPPGTL